MLSVSSGNHGDVVVIQVAGEVDATSAGLLREALTVAMSEGTPRLVADLSQVDFMDSTGLGVLVGRLKAVRQLGGSLHCVVTAERVQRIFNATGLERVIPLHVSLEEAIAAAALPHS